ncbi:hypothetical protein IFU39_16645 [Paenibacillus sp. CFBP 13594]|nr:hypothetical protein [Paenibacillus sp. CFBP 13594]
MESITNWNELTEHLKQIEMAQERTLIDDMKLQKHIKALARKEGVIRWNKDKNDTVESLSETPYGIGYRYYRDLLNEVSYIFAKKKYIIYFS